MGKYFFFSTALCCPSLLMPFLLMWIQSLLFYMLSLHTSQLNNPVFAYKGQARCLQVFTFFIIENTAPTSVALCQTRFTYIPYTNTSHVMASRTLMNYLYFTMFFVQLTHLKNQFTVWNLSNTFHGKKYIQCFDCHDLKKGHYKRSKSLTNRMSYFIQSCESIINE